jgi:hypothetical protein
MFQMRELPSSGAPMIEAISTSETSASFHYTAFYPQDSNVSVNAV